MPSFSRQTRRDFLKRSLLLSGGALAAPRLARAAASPNGKLNIAVIGVANQGEYNLKNVSSENIVALCDIDDALLGKAAANYPGVKTYNDFRRMLEQKDIDAVVVATPDHTHAVAAVAALKSGRHVYCEKPLARTISEVRFITETARKEKRVTQMGTQIHAGNNYRRVVELVQGGVIGPVKEVHVWVTASYGGKAVPSEAPPVPAKLHYDLWLGPAAHRPYHPDYLPFVWRNWWAFGGGALADIACHYMDLPHWALDLRHAASAEVLDGPPVDSESPPPWLVVRYQYPARGAKPPVALTWYHGGKQPAHISPELGAKWKNAILFMGEKGSVISDYSKHQLLPENDFASFQPPAPTIPNSIGHHKEWIEAIKNGGQTTCQFDYSGPLSETVLLGNVAYRAGKKLVRPRA